MRNYEQPPHVCMEKCRSSGHTAGSQLNTLGNEWASSKHSIADNLFYRYDFDLSWAARIRVNMMFHVPEYIYYSSRIRSC